MCQDVRGVVRRQDVFDREYELDRKPGWGSCFASAPYFASALANSPLRKVSGPVCCGEVDVKIADDRTSSQRAGALLRSRASGR